MSHQVKLFWYARGGEISRMGPFESHVEASEATLGLDGLPVSGAYVWPERKTVRKPTPRKRKNMKERCEHCNELTDKLCPDGYCEKCHVSISFHECCTKTYNALQLLAMGHSVQEIRELYPEAEI